jgi:predicted phosphohydrolase
MPLKIQYCSDLHLEFRENNAIDKGNLIPPMGQVLILGGDITLFSEMHRNQDFFDYISDNFETTYWIPGNHEYYHSDAHERVGILDESIRSNVHLVNNVTRFHDDVKLIFSTMWTKISLSNARYIESSMNDFRIIKYQGSRLTTELYNKLHEDCLAFLKAEIDSDFEGKTVVTTHHIPTFKNYPEQFKGDVLNEAFAVELSDYIEQSNIAYWIYGHHHSNIPDYKIGNTLMLTNQLGYVRYGEHRTFHPDKTIAL